MTLTYDWTVTIGGVNVSGLVKSGGTIDYGRPTAFTEFVAPQAVFDMFTAADYPNYSGSWPTVTLGDPVIIHVTWDGITQHRRFTGVVQALDWSTSGMRVTCTGTSTDWQLKSCGSTEGLPYTITDELETIRVDRWCDEAAVSITIEGTPARRVRAVPPEQTSQPLLDTLLRIASDCDGLLMEDRLGAIHYRTRNFDRPAPYALPAAVVERDSLDLVYERGTHINAVRVFYGEPNATTGNQSYVYTNDTATYGTILDPDIGERITELYTDIRYAAGATGKATVYLEKHRLEWALPDVVLVMNQATGTQADAIFDLQENWMVTVGSLPTGCPITSYDGDILGVTDIMHETDYRIILHLGPRIADTGAIPEAPVFAADSCTGGTESTYEDANGFLWQVHVFDTAGTYTLTCNEPVTGDALVVGGGGGGANGSLSYSAGGGGAGAVFNQELTFTPGTISVTVGDAGAVATAGGTSKLADVWCYGGGKGGAAARSAGVGGNGGYGGGGGGDNNAGGTGTYGSIDGGVTTNTSVILGGAGQSYAAGGDGGGASLSSAITGTTVIYAKGGAGGNIPFWIGNPGSTPGSGGEGGGAINGPGAAGAAGIVVYRYRIG